MADLMLAVGTLRKRPAGETLDSQTIKNNKDTASDNGETAVLKAKLEAMELALKSKDDLLRMTDEQLRQAQAREVFYQEELRSIRLLVAPPKPEEKRKRFLGIF